MKTCSEPGCNNFQFGGGYCKYHGYRRSMFGGDLYKKKKKTKEPELFSAPQIPKKESAKRKKENKFYRERLEERWQKSVEEKTNFCFFCGKMMDKREDNHHLTGRDVTILDEATWAWAHRKCHAAYHDCTVEQLIALGWWDDYLARIREKDVSTYYKELRKIEKSKNNDENFDL